MNPQKSNSVANRKKTKNQTLIPYLAPASERTISVLQMVVSFVEECKFLTNWNTVEHEGWRLPATATPHCWCGVWQTVGCLNEKLHKKLGKGRTYFIKQYQRACYRASCQVCYPKWIVRQANLATRKIEHYSKKTNLKPKHLILCIPPSQHCLPVEKLRARMREVLKKAHWKGGAVIFHPFKRDKRTRNFYYFPHFHLVGFGYRFQIAEAYGKFGWFIKIGEERESVFQTFCYLLSHCGIKKGKHSVTWVGDLSYGKLKLEKEPKITCCPVCGGKFMPIYYDGAHPPVPPDQYYEGPVDSDGGWHIVNTEKFVEPTFEYAPTRELNDAIASVALPN